MIEPVGYVGPCSRPKGPEHRALCIPLLLNRQSTRTQCKTPASGKHNKTWCRRAWLERRNFQPPALLPNSMMPATKTARQFGIVQPPQQPDFPRGPALPCGRKPNAALLPHRDDFFDCTTRAAGDGRVCHFAEQLQFGHFSWLPAPGYCGSRHQITFSCPIGVGFQAHLITS
jgi:hypothetical protein